jgi:phage terminase small subunit
MPRSAAEEVRLWKDILKEKGLPLDIPYFSKVDLCPPLSNQSQEELFHDFVEGEAREHKERQLMGNDAGYIKKKMDIRKRIREIFAAKDEMERRMKKAADLEEETMNKKKKKKKNKKKKMKRKQHGDEYNSNNKKMKMMIMKKKATRITVF